MTTTINASTTAGLVQTADTSGVLALQTAGTTAVTVDASQNVGIGTTTLTNKFNVAGAIQSSSALVAIATNTVAMSQESGFARLAAFGPNGSTAGTLYLYVIDSNGGNQRGMVIDSSGRVSIGTTTPNASANTTIKASAAADYQIQLEQSNVTDGYGLRCSASDGDLTFNRYVSSAYTERMRLTTGGNLTISGATATKASGTTWANPSDQRLKNNIRDYDKGTAELMQVRVREWEYNGKGGTTDGMKGLGVIADEVMTVLPATVENYDAKLNVDDEETTAIKKFDATEITWLLVKTAQEQQALITQLQADVAALKGATP
jgi:hypothetical protein